MKNNIEFMNQMKEFMSMCLPRHWKYRLQIRHRHSLLETQTLRADSRLSVNQYPWGLVNAG